MVKPKPSATSLNASHRSSTHARGTVKIAVKKTRQGNFLLISTWTVVNNNGNFRQDLREDQFTKNMK